MVTPTGQDQPQPILLQPLGTAITFWRWELTLAADCPHQTLPAKKMRVIGRTDDATFMAYGHDRRYSHGRTLRHAVIEFHQGGRVRTVRHYTAIFTDGPWEAWALRWALRYVQTLGPARI